MPTTSRVPSRVLIISLRRDRDARICIRGPFEKGAAQRWPILPIFKEIACLTVRAMPTSSRVPSRVLIISLRRDRDARIWIRGPSEKGAAQRWPILPIFPEIACLTIRAMQTSSRVPSRVLLSLLHVCLYNQTVRNLRNIVNRYHRFNQLLPLLAILGQTR